MAKKKRVTPTASCDQPECINDAAFGFRQTDNVSGFTTGGTVLLSSKNWCEEHDSLMRPQFAFKRGTYVDFRL